MKVFVIAPNCYNILFVGVNGENDCLYDFEQAFFGWQTAYESFLRFNFNTFWFISIIYLISIFFEFFILFILHVLLPGLSHNHKVHLVNRQNQESSN